MDRLKTAIVGCGGVHVMHAQALVDMAEAELCVLCDIKPERAQASAERFGGRPETEFEAVLRDPDIDVVHLCVPHYLHAPMAIAALKAGKHVLCEKPMATSIADAKAMAEAAKEAQGQLGIIFQNRYNAASVRLKGLIEGGKMGRLIALRGLVDWKRDQAYYSDDWHGRPALEGGGVMMNQAIHTLDLLQWMAGAQAEFVSGIVGNTSLQGLMGVEDTASFRITFDNGLIGVFQATLGYALDSEVEVEAVLEGGTLLLKGEHLYRREGEEMVLVQGKAREEAGGKDYWGTGHALEIADFYRSLLAGTPVAIGCREAFPAFAIVQALYESARRGALPAMVERLE